MDYFIEIKELYEKSRKYLEEEWKKDPETEPYKSKYKAMEYLKSIKEKCLDLLEKSSENNEKIKGMLSVTYLHMGMVSVDTEETSAGELNFSKCLETLPAENDKKYILIAMTARNNLGILWCQRSEVNKAKDYLEECEKLYNGFVDDGNLDNALSLHDHFDYSVETSENSASSEIEKVGTHFRAGKLCHVSCI